MNHHFRSTHRSRGFPYGSSTSLLDAHFVGLEPALDGFLGVFVELYDLGEDFARDASPHSLRTGAGDRDPERYVVVQTAAGSGNVILTVSSASESRARGIFGRVCGTGVPASSGEIPP